MIINKFFSSSCIRGCICKITIAENSRKNAAFLNVVIYFNIFLLSSLLLFGRESVFAQDINRFGISMKFCVFYTYFDIKQTKKLLCFYKHFFKNHPTSLVTNNHQIDWLITFNRYFFKKLFQHIRNRCKILRFSIPVLNLSKCFFLSHICTFCKVLS